MIELDRCSALVILQEVISYIDIHEGWSLLTQIDCCRILLNIHIQKFTSQVDLFDSGCIVPVAIVSFANDGYFFVNTIIEVLKIGCEIQGNTIKIRYETQIHFSICWCLEAKGDCRKENGQGRPNSLCLCDDVIA